MQEEYVRVARLPHAQPVPQAWPAPERGHGSTSEDRRDEDPLAARAKEIWVAESRLVSRFLEVTLRKVTLLDEYGDESWDDLNREIERVLGKLRKKYPADFDRRWDLTLVQHRGSPPAAPPGTEALEPGWDGQRGAYVVWETTVRRITKGDAPDAAIHPWRRYYAKGASDALAQHGDALLAESRERKRARRCGRDPLSLALSDQLAKAFRVHHAQHAEQRPSDPSIGEISGEDFEAAVMGWLRSLGAEDVRGTPRSGDQGADVIFKCAERRVAVQCKRYKDKVSNKAVQEVHAAKTIYGCSDAWVVTTGIATPGAREAAQKTGVKLVERATTRGSLRAAYAELTGRVV